ncbi:MAG: hypothetical protein JMDDDDMK_00441 [Acidobacteria bacterium]|nr:hypothetical protein [Acidobacteriota bacterium]
MRGSRLTANPLSTAPGGMAIRWMFSQCVRGKRNRARSNWKTLTCWRSPPPTRWRSCAIVNTSGCSGAVARWLACRLMAARRVTCSKTYRRPTGRRMESSLRWRAGSMDRASSNIPSVRYSINQPAISIIRVFHRREIGSPSWTIRRLSTLADGWWWWTSTERRR